MQSDEFNEQCQHSKMCIRKIIKKKVRKLHLESSCTMNNLFIFYETKCWRCNQQKKLNSFQEYCLLLLMEVIRNSFE